jgi:hypothetical protein
MDRDNLFIHGSDPAAEKRVGYDEETSAGSFQFPLQAHRLQLLGKEVAEGHLLVAVYPFDHGFLSRVEPRPFH